MKRNYEEFCEYVKENILNSMPDGAERKVGLQMCMKNNNIRLVGLTLIKNGNCIAPNLYLEPYYEEYCVGESSIEEILNEIADFYLKAEANASVPFDIQMMSEDHIIGTLVSILNNEDFLKDIPYIEVNEDFALIFKYYLASAPDGGHGTITITDSLAESNALTTEKLLECALKNTPRLLPVSFQSMHEVLSEMMGVDLADLLTQECDSIPMYVLSNTEKYMGASAILYPDTRKMLLEKFDSDLVLIPSSIHEWIIVPFDELTDMEELSAMVQEVNQSHVAPSEVLGERVYLFTRKELSNTNQVLPIFEPATVRL